MKEVALALLRGHANPTEKLNLLREYLQAMVLRSFHESEAFLNLAFVGGTALRFVHNLPRFSEDLDFSLEKRDGYNPELWLGKVKSDLRLQGFDVTVTWNGNTTVHKSWIKVAGLMKEAGLTDQASQNLSIKLEIDTVPPAGAVSERGLVNRHALLSLCSYNLPSLMAGKVHALLTRKYAKGRDWYDLVWYRGKLPPVEPNLEQLQQALDQTQGRGVVDASAWKQRVTQKLQTTDCSLLIKDVQNFLEYPAEAALLTQENICALLSNA